MIVAPAQDHAQQSMPSKKADYAGPLMNFQPEIVQNFSNTCPVVDKL